MIPDRVRAEWDRAPQYNACRLCEHRTANNGCKHPAVHSPDVARARAHGGACGPEAVYLSFPGLEPAGVHVAAMYAAVQSGSATGGNLK